LPSTLSKIWNKAVREGDVNVFSWYKRRNRTHKLDSSLNEKNILHRPYPPWVIQVEVTNRCNLRCTNCSNSAAAAGGFTDISPEFLHGILAQLPRETDISLNGIGEPFMHKGIFELFGAVEKRGHNLSFITNGMLLDESNIRRLGDFKKLKYIGISLDGDSKELNESIRVGMRFEKVIENIIALRKALSVEIGIHFTAIRRNYKKFPGVIELARGLGVAKVTAAGLFEWNDDLKKESVSYSEFCRDVGSEESLRERYPDMQVTVVLAGRFESRARPHCIQPYNFLFIDCIGNVLPCCQQTTPVIGKNIGNLNSKNLDEVWNSAEMTAFRSSMHEGKNPACALCFLRGR